MSELPAAASCAICMSPIGAADALRACEGCRAPYHEECWSENGGCAVYGCAHVPKTEGLKPLEIPPAFWGREDKDCPRCGMKIMAVAVRCRHCGAEVEARPEEKAAFDSRAARRTRTPQYRRAAVLFVVLSLLPGLSLVTLLVGTYHYRSNRGEIARVPGGTEGLFRIAIATAAAQVAILLFGVVAWWVRFVIFE
jgi:Prokaryotic RING finger family 1